MIKKVWTRLALLIALAVVPATMLQLYLQLDSLNLIFDLVGRSGARATIDSYLQSLRNQAKADPSRTDTLRREFDEASRAKISLEELFLSKDAINRDLRVQSIFSTATILILSLFLGAFVSNAIVEVVRRLLMQRDRDASKLKDLESLENWQTVARMLVHELRGPMTPIRLVATDIEAKYCALGAEAFALYLKQARDLLEDQVMAVEAMVKAFTRFGALPHPNLKPLLVQTLLDGTMERYGRSFGEKVKFNVITPPANLSVMGDERLLGDLFFNLFRNAAEANNNQTTITISTTTSGSMAILKIANTGVKISPDITTKIFAPNVTTKASSAKGNMGLGLTIARKIALDHGGDLFLDLDPLFEGACFCLEIPLAVYS